MLQYATVTDVTFRIYFLHSFYTSKHTLSIFLPLRHHSSVSGDQFQSWSQADHYDCPGPYLMIKEQMLD